MINSDLICDKNTLSDQVGYLCSYMNAKKKKKKKKRNIHNI